VWKSNEVQVQGMIDEVMLTLLLFSEQTRRTGLQCREAVIGC